MLAIKRIYFYCVTYFRLLLLILISKFVIFEYERRATLSCRNRNMLWVNKSSTSRIPVTIEHVVEGEGPLTFLMLVRASTSVVLHPVCLSCIGEGEGLQGLLDAESQKLLIFNCHCYHCYYYHQQHHYCFQFYYYRYTPYVLYKNYRTGNSLIFRNYKSQVVILRFFQIQHSFISPQVKQSEIIITRN